MKINSINSVNTINYNRTKNARNDARFGACIEVEPFAKTVIGTTALVTVRENLAKCGTAIVRQLNRTVRKFDNALVNSLKRVDPDFNHSSYATSYIANNGKLYILTGRDAEYARKVGKKIGLAKHAGYRNSFEEQNARTQYSNISGYITSRRIKPVTNIDGREVKLSACFDTKYDKNLDCCKFIYDSARIASK